MFFVTFINTTKLTLAANLAMPTSLAETSGGEKKWNVLWPPLMLRSVHFSTSTKTLVLCMRHKWGGLDGFGNGTIAGTLNELGKLLGIWETRGIATIEILCPPPADQLSFICGYNSLSQDSGWDSIKKTGQNLSTS